MTLVYTTNVLHSLHSIENRVEIYLLDYTRFNPQVQRLKTWLSPEELSRVQRYQRWADQDRFILQHGLSRQILAHHLGISPQAVEINSPKYGKPETKGLHFNISHSRNYLAEAVSKEISVGEDIECIIRDIDMKHVAAIVLSDAERKKLYALPTRQQKMTLLQTWVCKEAYWKLVGKGLTAMIKQFEVSPTGERDIYKMKSTTGESVAHQIHSFSSTPHKLVGAIAYGGSHAEITFRKDELPDLH